MRTPGRWSDYLGKFQVETFKLKLSSWKWWNPGCEPATGSGRYAVWRLKQLPTRKFQDDAKILILILHFCSTIQSLQCTFAHDPPDLSPALPLFVNDRLLSIKVLLSSITLSRPGNQKVALAFALLRIRPNRFVMHEFAGYESSTYESPTYD